MRTWRLRFILLWVIGVINLFAGQGEDYALKHARELLQSSPLIDGHNDLPWVLREHEKAPGDAAVYDLRQKGKGDRPLKESQFQPFELTTFWGPAHPPSYAAL